VLQAAGIDPSGQRIAHAVGQAELSGVLCSGPRRGWQHTYLPFDARVELNRSAERWRPSLLCSPRSQDVVVRFSRGLGLPESMPDFLGLAVKFSDAYGPGWDQDLLFVTSGTGTVARHSLIPTTGFMSRAYSTVLPYRWQGRLVTYGATPHSMDGRVSTIEDLRRRASDGQVVLDLSAAAEGERHETIGTLTLGEPRGRGVDEALRFNPWNSFAALKPAGALNDLRRDSYRASQAARSRS